MARVHVVDNDDDIRLAVRDLLEDEGYTVSEAADGAAGLAFLRASAHPLVVLVDLLMPPPDGVAFMAEVAADPSLAARHCYVVMTASRAAHLDLSEEVRCLLAAPVLFKPFEVEDLLAAVAEAVRRLDGG